jgi:hypothetical protein
VAASDTMHFDDGQWVEAGARNVNITSIEGLAGCPTMTEEWEVRPQADGTLIGTDTRQIQGTCGEAAGAKGVIPVKFTRIGPVPRGVLGIPTGIN